MSEPDQISRIRGRSLTAEYFLDSLETEILGRPVARIRKLEILDAAGADRALQPFFDWCLANHVALCSCRLPQDRREEALLLEKLGFRWIELNYRPELRQLRGTSLSGGDIRVSRAGEDDRDLLADMAAGAFDFGRFHQDPRLGPVIGNRRYRHWVERAFEVGDQHVLKCVLGREIIGFFVVEEPNEEEVLWSLTALGRKWQGQGLGWSTWQAVLLHHQHKGVLRVSTSISSHNAAVMNLYIRMGWRFPAPLATFHWCSDESPGSR